MANAERKRITAFFICRKIVYRFQGAKVLKKNDDRLTECIIDFSVCIIFSTFSGECYEVKQAKEEFVYLSKCLIVYLSKCLNV